MGRSAHPVRTAVCRSAPHPPPQFGQLWPDRLDTPPQTIGTVAVALMIGDEPGDQCCGRSSSAAKKADAVFKIELALRNSAFSRFNRLSSADSSVVVPAREPESTWACGTHLRTVSAKPAPGRRATSLVAAPSEPCSSLISATIRTARSRSSGGYLLDEPPDMTPTFPRSGVSGHAGAVHAECWEGKCDLTFACQYLDEIYLRETIDEGWEAIWIVGCGPDRC